jgi:hypothetical protein
VGGLNYNGLKTLRNAEELNIYQRGVLPSWSSVQRVTYSTSMKWLKGRLWRFYLFWMVLSYGDGIFHLKAGVKITDSQTVDPIEMVFQCTP